MAIDAKKKQALVAQKSKKMQPPKKGADGKKTMPPQHDEEDEHDEGEEDTDAGQHGKGGGEKDDGQIANECNERLKNDEGDEHLMQLAEGYDPEEDGNPPSWINADDEDVWERAKAAADKVAEPDDYWALVAHVFQQMGGEVSGGGGDDEHGGGDNQ